MLLSKQGRRWVIYVPEFFHLLHGDGGRVRLATEKQRIKTKDHAVSYVHAAMENGVFDGLSADGCLIKDQAGALICEVKRDTHRP